MCFSAFLLVSPPTAKKAMMQTRSRIGLYNVSVHGLLMLAELPRACCVQRGAAHWSHWKSWLGGPSAPKRHAPAPRDLPHFRLCFAHAARPRLRPPRQVEEATPEEVLTLYDTASKLGGPAAEAAARRIFETGA